jgi:transcriptional regulator with XRE-family HTH domain
MDATGDLIFARRLKEVRDLRHMSQGDLADKIGKEAGLISHFETARRAPSLLVLKKLADALQVTIDYLTGRSDDPTGSAPQDVGDSMVARINRSVKTLDQAQMETVAQMVDGLARSKRVPKP